MEPSPTTKSQERSARGNACQSPQTTHRFPEMFPGQTALVIAGELSTAISEVRSGQRISAIPGVTPSSSAWSGRPGCAAAQAYAASSIDPISSADGRNGGPRARNESAKLFQYDIAFAVSSFPAIFGIALPLDRGL